MARATALLHCAEMDGWSRVQMIHQLERQLAAGFFQAAPVNDPLPSAADGYQGSREAWRCFLRTGAKG